jgi:hypothetical protein
MYCACVAELLDTATDGAELVGSYTNPALHDRNVSDVVVPSPDVLESDDVIPMLYTLVVALMSDTDPVDVNVKVNSPGSEILDELCRVHCFKLIVDVLMASVNVTNIVPAIGSSPKFVS